MNGWWLTFARFSLFFPIYTAGRLFGRMERHKRIGPGGWAAVMAVAVGVNLLIKSKVGCIPTVICAFPNFHDHSFFPFFTICTGLAFWFGFCSLASPLGKRAVVRVMAGNSYAIMIHHLLGFFLVKTFYACTNRWYGWFADFDWVRYRHEFGYYYLPNGSDWGWTIYTVAGVVVGIALGILTRKFAKALLAVFDKVVKSATARWKASPLSRFLRARSPAPRSAKKILVFGARGMFGHVVVRYLSGLGTYQVVACARGLQPHEGHSVEVTDFPAVRDVLEKERPDIVLNAVGMLVKACSDRPDQAILVNSYFPHCLARLGGELGFKLIHISTDCVFSGKTGGYREDSFRDGDLPYDRTKAMGEVVDSRNLTIRTSIIGPEVRENGTGLFRWFMQQHGTVRGYTNAFRSGVTSLELAKAVDAAIEQNLSGLYHLAMPKISKFDLLELFRDIWRKDDVEILPSADFHCNRELLCTRKDFQYALPASHRAMLEELRRWY